MTTEPQMPMVPRAARGLARNEAAEGPPLCTYCGLAMSDVRNGGVTMTMWPERSPLVLPGNHQQAETVFAFCSMPCASHGAVEIAVSSALAASGGAE